MPSLFSLGLVLLAGSAGLVSAIPTSAHDIQFDWTCVQPETSTDPSKWSTEKFIEDNLAIPDGLLPVFWAGHLNGTSVRPVAEKCAAQRNGTTLGQVMCNYNKNHDPKFVMPVGLGPLWSHASKVFGAKTTGTAWAVFGEALATSDWLRAEWPALVAANVSTVFGIKGDTCLETCYYTCPTPQDCAKWPKACLVTGSS